MPPFQGANVGGIPFRVNQTQKEVVGGICWYCWGYLNLDKNG
jgi:hypothetical protein